jgi:RHS repeat-associated protein
MIKINYAGSGNLSQFTCDGLGQLVTIVEQAGGSITGTKQFIWSLGSRNEARDAAGIVSNQYFLLGEVQGSSKYFYTLDHLHSTRELTNATGTLTSQYAYDPYGRQSSLLTGGITSSVSYAGYYAHAPSNLNLTLTRAYAPNNSRWLSRDPSGEINGTNLNAYVNNNPINHRDASGLGPLPLCNDWGDLAWWLGFLIYLASIGYFGAAGAYAGYAFGGPFGGLILGALGLAFGYFFGRWAGGFFGFGR